jgi:hypothetical protein
MGQTQKCAASWWEKGSIVHGQQQKFNIEIFLLVPNNKGQFWQLLVNACQDIILQQGLSHAFL